MNWKKVSVITTEEAADVIASMLMDAGAGGVEIDGGELPAAQDDESPASSRPRSADVTVSAYYGETGFAPVLAEIRERVGVLAQGLAVDDVPDTDWNENFRKHFTTFRAAGRFVIKPTWETYAPKQDDIIIELDPGMAFGSGVHETTRLCLELLQKYMPPSAAVLDVGCGSGILGIAAAKLGARRVLALDYDAVSVDVARRNAAANDADVMTVRRSDLLQNADAGPYDVILANIIADIVIRLNGDAGSRLAPNGVYIVSGIIGERLDDVMVSLEKNGFEVIESLALADWRALAARRRDASVLR